LERRRKPTFKSLCLHNGIYIVLIKHYQQKGLVTGEEDNLIIHTVEDTAEVQVERGNTAVNTRSVGLMRSGRRQFLSRVAQTPESSPVVGWMYQLLI